ncbi:MAG: VCBS repeat-containing protein, partial [Thermoanaerobaculia bacterium]|nr:VCBS repeat-containing protein [Thermoanaerobaculia bacterium]
MKNEKNQSSAEVDFVLPFENHLVPVEVKSGKSGKMRALQIYMDTCDHDFAIRLEKSDTHHIHFMQKLLFPILLCFFIPEKAHAQFSNTPQILTQSTNANQLGKWTADLDADGDPDLLSAYLNSLIWYENDGAAHFSNDREIMTADMVNSIGFLTGTFEDLTADGLPDLVFDRAWRKNLGGGQFAPQATILANTLATLCDVDSDGLSDAITLDYTKNWQRNLGAGIFGARQTLRTVTDADVYNLKIDLDSDGRQDFFARHDNAFFWYKNLGNSQLDTVQLLPTFPGAVSVANLDNNGKPDLLLGTDGNIFWYEYDSSGQQTLRQTLPQYYGGELSLGDLDADGDLDLFVGSAGTVNGHRAKYFAFDAATGLFDPVPKNHNSFLHDHTYSEILDLNGDTKPDILVGDTGGGQQLGWLENLAPGSFTGYKNINRKFGLPFEIEIADLENDGDMDIFTVGFVLENLGGGQYAEKRAATPGSGSRAFSGDLDGDGVKDLALPLGDSISWRKGLGNGQFGAPKLLPGLVTSCKQVGGGDLDNDGDLDLFAANGTDAVVANARFYWFENDESGNFTGHLLETGIQFCSNAFALDANEDGLLDMGLLFFNGHAPRVYLNLGGGNFAPPTSLFPAGTPSPGNVNQDLLTDLDGDG